MGSPMRGLNAMKTRKRWLSLPVLIVASLLAPLGARAQRVTWTIDGVERQADVYVPEKDPRPNKIPVVFAFHWHGGTMQQDAQVFHFQKVWPEAIVVYMQGLPTRANSPNDYGWQHEAGVEGDRDLKFFDTVLADLRQKFPIDDRRIYASGFSDGAQFTYFLWSARPKTFAAFAIVAGRILAPSVKITEPRPVYYVVGTQDPGYKQIMAAMDMVKQLNGATGEGVACGEMCTKYASPKGAPVITYIHDHGHVYPIPISTQFVEFFKQHTLD